MRNCCTQLCVASTSATGSLCVFSTRRERPCFICSFCYLLAVALLGFAGSRGNCWWWVIGFRGFVFVTSLARHPFRNIWFELFLFWLMRTVARMRWGRLIAQKLEGNSTRACLISNKFAQSIRSFVFLVVHRLHPSLRLHSSSAPVLHTYSSRIWRNEVKVVCREVESHLMLRPQLLIGLGVLVQISPRLLMVTSFFITNFVIAFGVN